MDIWPLDEGQTQAVVLSLQVACVAVVFSLPIGIALGWVLARKQFWGKTLVETLVFLPLVLPPVVTGISVACAVRSPRLARRCAREMARRAFRV